MPKPMTGRDLFEVLREAGFEVPSSAFSIAIAAYAPDDQVTVTVEFRGREEPLTAVAQAIAADGRMESI